MKYLSLLLALATYAVAGSDPKEATCENEETVVCESNGNGLVTLGNIATGLLGESCSNGNFYCCSTKDVEQIGVLNLDVNVQCSLNDIL
ncbi:uncharacterized protein N7482_001369 [Penicillium canariense]|uniref:Hydrophobin n=1 Tax=Penicillium canariense TaxID=189055 RepID=A0A9W9IFH6_9EURO|nr:uncharacterized protein N7482_001369 [Penicillium canariense]KAJ5175492.1 hypothetical protein N7482_001369 [Penicillium canariense]